MVNMKTPALTHIAVFIAFAFVGPGTIPAVNAQVAPVLPASPPDSGVPAGAQVTLSSDRLTYKLGELMPVLFTLKNIGGTPFHFNEGSDYRGADRSLRYIVTAHDSEGRRVADPNPGQSDMGGVSAFHAPLVTGGTWSQTVEITRYLRFEQPGTYTVTISHDLGWKPTADRPLPSGSITLTLTRPTPGEAEAIVRRLSNTPNESAYEKLADFYPIRDPVYLPILVARGKAGDLGAIEGIAYSIATPEATEALIGFLSSPNRAVVKETAASILWRLPQSPEDAMYLNRHPSANGGPVDPTLFEYLNRQSWRPEFGKPVRAAARRLLRGSEEEKQLGSNLLEHLGN